MSFIISKRQSVNYEKETFLFCGLLGRNISVAEKAFAKLEQNPEMWERIVMIANHNLLTPTLYAALLKKGLLQRMKESQLRDFLEEVYRINEERNRAIVKQIKEIGEILEQANIEPLVLKGGASLIEELYPMPGMRMMNDLDIMIVPEKFEKARQLLFEHGYVEFGRDMNRWHHHTPRIRKEGRPAAVEPHFRVIFDREVEYIPYNNETSRPSRNPQLPTTRVLKPVWHLYHTFLHAAVIDKHHQHWILGLRYLYDFSILCEAYAEEIDWDELYRLARRYEHHRILEDYLYLAHRLYGLQTPIPYNRFRGWALLRRSLWVMRLEPGSTLYKFYAAFVDFSEIYGYEKLKEYYGLSSRWQYPTALVRYFLYHGKKHLLH